MKQNEPVKGEHGLVVAFLRQSLALRHDRRIGRDMRADVRKCIDILRRNRAMIQGKGN